MSLRSPPPLRKGDTVAVIAPAGPVPLTRLRAGLACLDSEFRLRVPDDIARRDGFLAGSDQQRAEELNAALRNPDVRAIWAARGGYGCSRLLPLLDAQALASDPKLLIGFSDLTVLLCWAARHGLQSLHAPVLTQLGELGAEDLDWTLRLARGEGQGGLMAEGLQGADCEGNLIGGNLSILAHLCGTDIAPDYRQALCILEDVGERPYAVDRYLGQLLDQAGESRIRDSAAVLLGDFTRCAEESDDSQDPVEVARTRLASASIAVVSGLPVGHGARNRAFIFGGSAELVDGRLSLR